MCLEELVEMLPDAWNPLHHVVRRSVGHPGRRSALGVHATSSDLSVGEAASQIARQEPVDRFHVVGTQHPTEVVVQLKVGRRACGRRLVHRSNYVRTDRTTQSNLHQTSVKHNKCAIKTKLSSVTYNRMTKY